ncbi:hypothetical protein GBF38_001343, partial [Nibea albiflora]
KDTNESNETEGKTAPEIYTTVKHLRETERGAEGAWLREEEEEVEVVEEVVELQKVEGEKEERERGDKDRVKEVKREN